jgi:hypothetical protein
MSRVITGTVKLYCGRQEKSEAMVIASESDRLCDPGRKSQPGGVGFQHGRGITCNRVGFYKPMAGVYMLKGGGIPDTYPGTRDLTLAVGAIKGVSVRNLPG